MQILPGICVVNQLLEQRHAVRHDDVNDDHRTAIKSVWYASMRSCLSYLLACSAKDRRLARNSHPG